MASYLARRCLQAVLTLFLVTVITFVLLHTMPGSSNIGWILLGRDATRARAAALDRQLGVNLPLPVQYVRWLITLVQGGGLAQNFQQVAPPTLEYLALGGGLALMVGILLAALQARHPRSTFDQLSSGAVYFLSTLPSFWIGLLLIYVFAMNFFWLPGSGPYPAPAAEGLRNWLFYMVLPVCTLAIPTVAGWSGLFRTAIEEALRSDYVRTAHAKGSTASRVLFGHALRNALLPIITVAGMSLATLFNNIVVLEMVFRMHGLGSTLIGALFSFDFNEAVDVVLVISIITAFGNLVADILYSLADPRIQFS